MSKEIQKTPDENTESSALAKIGLSDKQSRGAKWGRVLLALLIEEAKKLPGGSLAELLLKLSEEEAGEEDGKTLDEVLSISQQSSDGIKTLNAVINLVFAAVGEQNELLGKLTQQLEREGLPAAPEQITEFATEAALSAYRNRMAQITEFRFADYRGIEPTQSEEIPSPPLEEIYVVPRLIEERSRYGERERDRDFLHRLDNPELSNEEKEQYETEYKLFKTAFWRPEECGEMLGKVLSKAAHIVVKGAPGAGKSTLVRYLARCCATQGAFAAEDLQWTAELIPIVLPLAVFAEARTKMDKENLTLREHLDEKMRDWGGEALVSAIESALQAGKVFVLLDGVDEIPNETERDLIVRAIDSFLGSHAANRVLVTSRPIGYRRLAGEVPHFEVPHFTPEQVEEFVQKWQRAFEKRRRPEAPDYTLADSEAQKTLTEIRRPGNEKVAELATNPLLLVVISLICHAQITLPNKRVKLYDCAVRTLMGAWNRYRSLSGYNVGTNLETDDLIKVWGAIGFWMRHDKAIVVHRAELQRELVKVLVEEEIATDHPERMAKSYLDAAANRSGLLEERGPDYFAFWHPTFEEFLAATDLATPSGNPLKRLLPLRDKPRWCETVLLTVGVIGFLQNDKTAASRLVLDLAMQENDVLEPLFYPHLRLAAACVSEVAAASVDGVAGMRQSTQETIIVELAKVIQELPYAPLTDAFIQTVRAVPNLRPSPDTITTLAPLAKHRNGQVSGEAARLFSNVATSNDEARGVCRDLVNDKKTSAGARCHAALGLLRCGEYRPEIFQELAVFSAEHLFVETAVRDFFHSNPSVGAALIAGLGVEDIESRRKISRLIQGLEFFNDEVIEIWRAWLQDVGNIDLQQAATAAAGALIASNHIDEDLVKKLRLWLTQGGLLESNAASLMIKMGLIDEVKSAMNQWIDEGEFGNFLFCLPALIKQRPEDEDCKKFLLSTFRSPQFVLHKWAVGLMVETPWADELTPLLLSWLNSGIPHIQTDAARLLIKLGHSDEELVGVLLSVLKSGSSWDRRQSAELLINLNRADESVMEEVSSWLIDEDIAQVQTATRLLQKVGKVDERALKINLELAKADSATVLPLCRKVLVKQSLTEEDVKTLRDLVRQQEKDEGGQREARRRLFEWLYGALEPKSALAEC